MTMTNLLKFSPGNAKIEGIYSMSLPSGWACPFADKCLSKVDPITGKIQDGKNTEFRCFSATQENIFPTTRKQRAHNFELLRKLKTAEEMANLIHESLPKFGNIIGKVIRLHVAGDFFSQTYFDAWILVSKRNPKRIFYAYTKSLSYWIARLDSIPKNLKLTASKGGKLDSLITQYNLKFAQVVYSNEEAKKLKLKVDHDDSHAYKGNKSFALLIHGTQPAGSDAGKAKQELANNGWTGYQRPGGYKNNSYRTNRVAAAA